MNRDEPEKHGAASSRFGYDLRRFEPKGIGKAMMRNELIWSSVEMKRYELAMRGAARNWN